MINNKTIRNCRVSFPAIQGLVNNQVLGKILIKNIYQNWQGENILQIKDKHESNPYTLRIGTPNTDNQLKNDCMYLIPNYLAYNPVTRNIEKRELVDYRNTQTVYIGQSMDEQLYKDYRLYVNGNIVCDDLYLKNTNMSQTSLSQLVVNLVNKVEKLQSEVMELKRQTKNADIYTQGTL
jgi:hypothetical protein